LERHVDEYGSVVSKVPDVWGEERLTIHRQEYEEQLKDTLTQFQGTINAQLRRGDDAFLATAFSVSAAVGKGTKPTSNTAIGLLASNELTTPATPAEADASFGEFATESLRRTATNTPASATVPFTSDVALEPTVYLDQLSRYINHLHELRRINVGDDTNTLPGYSLNLIRVPVSVMPGNKTREGYGAEITFTVSPQIGPELLATTFRSMVLSDLEYQLTTPLTLAVNPPSAETWKTLEALSNALDDSRARYNWGDSSWWGDFTFGEALDNPALGMWATFLLKADAAGLLKTEKASTTKSVLNDEQKAFLEAFLKAIPDLEAVEPAENVRDGSSEAGQPLSILKNLSPLWFAKPGPVDSEPLKSTYEPSTVTKAVVNAYKGAESKVMAGKVFELQSILWMNAEQVISAPGRNTSRNSQLAFPLSQFSTIYGQHALLRVVLDAHYRIGPHGNGEAVQYQDTLSYLKEELSGAYELLERPENIQLWQCCNHSLVLAIRNRDKTQLNCMRTEFFNQLGTADHTTTGIYAWAIIVEAALLNERLIVDMREVASSHGCDCLVGDGMSFYEPRPTPEAAETFNQYVRCRWPIHVFHVDPVNQEQNVGDRFSSRRELQLALAVAVASGTVGADSATRYARRLEFDMDTISLNRTVVGFSHGEDTFGFRFQPRSQSPDTPRMGKAIHQMFHGINRDSVLDDQRIEPGSRECLALVVAPSFLRQLIVDVHSDWFPLTNPKKTRMTTSKAVDLSADIRQMQACAEMCVSDAGRYRDGEVYRLLRRVDQLSKELPMQTLRVEIPVSRPMGGFRLLANGGNFDRSAQLYGYYGEPGVHLKRKTSLFLLGENFRLQGMRVIAGGKPIENIPAITTSGKEAPAETNRNIISDTVLEVVIPDGVDTIEGTLEETERGISYVDVHVATYNGPSQHLRIPTIPPEEDAAAAEVDKKIDNKIAAHFALKHVDKYVWDADAVDVLLQVDARRHVVGVFQQTDVEITTPENSPFAGDNAKAKFRGWMFEKRAKKDVAAKPTSTAKMDLSFLCGLASVRDQTSGLENAVLTALTGYTVPPDIESFEIQGFLKFDDADGNADGQPIIKLENRLTLNIKVQACDPKCPEDMPSPPAAGMLNPFSEIQPASAVMTFPIRRQVKPVGKAGTLLLPATRPNRLLVK